ncbi:alpha/beta fold hydrolase [Pseudomonas sp. H22_DOA]|nr:alpha/beta fold hydrolase [Pseudomonas sp. H22_DOA]
MKTRKLVVNDLQLNVSICGQGSPLLLLNGLGGLIRTFDPIREALGDYTTITLDVPGVGKSHRPRWPLRLPRHADLIAEMLKQLGIKQIDVFGVSWGGALAQEFALRHPSMVRRLILAATSAGPVVLVKPAHIVDFLPGAKIPDCATARDRAIHYRRCCASVWQEACSRLIRAPITTSSLHWRAGPACCGCSIFVNVR